MQNVLEQPITGIKNTENPRHDIYTWVPYYIKKSTFATDPNEFPQQAKFIYITIDPIEEYDFAPELSLESAAEAAKRFTASLPEDIIDADLGPGL